MHRAIVAILALALSSACAPRTGTDAGPAAQDPSKMNPALENTYWKLIQLGEDTQIAGKGRQEPHLTLRPDQKRLTGTGGCNQLMGDYTLAGDRLRFGQVAGTLMACAEGMEQEQAYTQALQQVAQWRIVAGKLELLDGSGKVLARFEARD